MKARLLLDTHILVWMLFEPRRLSAEQARVIRNAQARKEPLGLSAISFLELAMRHQERKLYLKRDVGELLSDLESDAGFEVLPINADVALEAARLSVLRDPSDRVIVATARVNGLRLVTADERIVGSRAAVVVE